MMLDSDWRNVVKENLFPLIKQLEKDVCVFDESFSLNVELKLPARDLKDIDHILGVVDRLTSKAIKIDSNLNPFYRKQH